MAATSLSAATKLFSALSNHSRGYASAAAAQGAVLARSRAMRIGKSVKEETGRSAESAWVPDPVTGYYRPANRATEIDGAELRELLLKQSLKSH